MKYQPRKYTKEFLEELVKTHSNIRHIMLEQGMSLSSGSVFTLIRERIREYGIDTSHFSKHKPETVRRKNTPLEEVMVENSGYHRGHLKKRIIRDNIIEYKCNLCHIEPIWKDKPLVLILDHINGCYNDHRKENLRFLCPNCNSQEPTFSRGQRIHSKQ